MFWLNERKIWIDVGVNCWELVKNSHKHRNQSIKVFMFMCMEKGWKKFSKRQVVFELQANSYVFNMCDAPFVGHTFCSSTQAKDCVSIASEQWFLFFPFKTNCKNCKISNGKTKEKLHSFSAILLMQTGTFGTTLSNCEWVSEWCWLLLALGWADSMFTVCRRRRCLLAKAACVAVYCYPVRLKLMQSQPPPFTHRHRHTHTAQSRWKFVDF